MSATVLDVFDKTIQTTNIWLDEIMERIGPDRKLAWHTLGAVLRALRDRLPVDEGAHLAAQLPILVRGPTTTSGIRRQVFGRTGLKKSFSSTWPRGWEGCARQRAGSRAGRFLGP